MTIRAFHDRCLRSLSLSSRLTLLGFFLFFLLQGHIFGEEPPLIINPSDVEQAKQLDFQVRDYTPDEEFYLGTAFLWADPSKRDLGIFWLTRAAIHGNKKARQELNGILPIKYFDENSPEKTESNKSKSETDQQKGNPAK